jgi:putative membrane protein
MVITQNLSLWRILRNTWKVDLFLIVTCTLTYLLREYAIPHAIVLPAMVPTLLGTALAFFVGFNNNQAYDRWWEARIIWGALVNDSRTWARNILNYCSQGTLSPEAFEQLKHKMVFQHIGFVYALKDSLRPKQEEYHRRHFTAEDLEMIKHESNVPNAILTLHAKNLRTLLDHGCINDFRFMQLNENITAFTDHMGKSERIRNTVFPTSYSYFTQLFIWVLVIFITGILADTIGGWSILIGWITGFVFHISHQNGMLLMEPFEKIPTGIPLNQISRTIEINLLEMLKEHDIPDPVQPVKGEFIL